MSLTYDDNGNVLSQTNELGQVTTYTYNALNEPLTVADALGHITTYTYDTSGNLLTKTDALNHGTDTYTYYGNGLVHTHLDANSGTTTYTYDTAGHLLSSTNDDNKTTNYVFNSKGFMTSETDPKANETQYTYNNYGEILTKTDPANKVTTYTYDTMGRKSSMVDARTNETDYEYDGNGNLTTTTNALNKTVVNTYNSDDQIISTKDENNKHVYYAYDGFDQKASMSDNSVTPNVTTYTYNSRGWLTSSQLPSGKTTSYTYDALGEKLTQTNPDAYYQSLTYDAAGNLLTSTDEMGRETQYAYNADNWLITETQPDDTTLSYTYNNAGQKLTYTDAANNTADYTYDTLGQLTESNELGLDYAYGYDANGNLTDKTNAADSSATNYAYNSRNLLSGITYSDQTQAVGYTYDNDGNRATMTDANGTTDYTYDTLDRLTAVDNTTLGNIGYGYDDASNVTSIDYPGGITVHYAYNNNEQLSQVSNTYLGDVNYAYNQDGLTDQVSYPNTWAATYDYDANNNNASISYTNGTDSATYANTYDHSGLVTEEATTTPSITNDVNYAYDDNSRLSGKIVGNNTQTVTYNDSNSLTTNTSGATLAYNTDEQLQTLTNGNIENDYQYGNAEGDRTELNVNDNSTLTSSSYYFYNTADQLTGSSRMSMGPFSYKDTQYTYSGDDLMTGKTLSGSGITSLIDSTYTWNTISSIPELLEDEKYYYVYGDDGSPIAQINKYTDAVQYLHKDQLGSIRAVTSASGSLDAEYEYDAYGKTINGETSHHATVFGFAGQYLDTDTGLYYMRARWYDSNSGQFVSVDPLLSSTHIPYAYTNGSPLSYTDPLGLCDTGFWNDFWHSFTQASTGGVVTLDDSHQYLPAPDESSPGYFLGGLTGFAVDMRGLVEARNARLGETIEAASDGGAAARSASNGSSAGSGIYARLSSEDIVTNIKTLAKGTGSVRTVQSTAEIEVLYEKYIAGETTEPFVTSGNSSNFASYVTRGDGVRVGIRKSKSGNYQSPDTLVVDVPNGDGTYKNYVVHSLDSTSVQSILGSR